MGLSIVEYRGLYIVEFMSLSIVEYRGLSITSSISQSLGPESFQTWLPIGPDYTTLLGLTRSEWQSAPATRPLSECLLGLTAES